MDRSTLETHLQKMGWDPSEHDEKTLYAERETDEGEVGVYLRLDEHWLVASVVPFLATGGDNSFELARWLLRMNRDMVQSKFAYDEDGDVVLTVELPTESLDFEEIEGSLEGLVKSVAKHRRILRAAAEH